MPLSLTRPSLAAILAYRPATQKGTIIRVRCSRTPFSLPMPFRTTVMAVEYDDGCTSPLSMESTEAHRHHHHEQQHGADSLSPTHSAVSLDNGVTVLDAYYMHLAGDDAFDDCDDRDATPTVADAGVAAAAAAAAVAPALPLWQGPSMLKPLGLGSSGRSEEDGERSSRATRFVSVNPESNRGGGYGSNKNNDIIVMVQQHQVALSGSSSLCVGNLSTVLSVSDVEQHMETEEYARKALLALTQHRRNGGLSEKSSSAALLQRNNHNRVITSKSNRCDEDCDDDHPLRLRCTNEGQGSSDGASVSLLKAKQIDSICSCSSLPP